MYIHIHKCIFNLSIHLYTYPSIHLSIHSSIHLSNLSIFIYPYINIWDILMAFMCIYWTILRTAIYWDRLTQ